MIEDKKVGKSLILLRLTREYFLTKDYTPTDGIEHLEKTYTINGKEITLKIDDTFGNIFFIKFEINRDITWILLGNKKDLKNSVIFVNVYFLKYIYIIWIY